MQLDAFNLVQRVGCEIAFATVRTGDNGHFFYDQQVRAFAVAPSNMPDLCAALATDFAGERFCFQVIRCRP